MKVLVEVVNDRFSEISTVYPFQRVRLFATEDEANIWGKEHNSACPCLSETEHFLYEGGKRLWFVTELNKLFGNSEGQIECTEIKQALCEGQSMYERKVKKRNPVEGLPRVAMGLAYNGGDSNGRP